MSLRPIRLVFPGKQVYQAVMNLKHLVAYVGRVCNPEGYLVMVNGLLYLTLGVIDIAESTTATADLRLFTSLGEVDRARYSFFCSVELFIYAIYQGRSMHLLAPPWYQVVQNFWLPPGLLNTLPEEFDLPI